MAAAARGGRAASTQKRKGREYKEVSRLAEKSIPTKRREGVFFCVLIGFTSSLTAAVLGEAPSPPAPPGLAQPGMQFAGRSVGGIRVNAARAFCGGGHRRWGSSVLPTSISTDALRTIHLTCCESVTVSSCLADNMAKGIHQLNWELRVS